MQTSANDRTPESRTRATLVALAALALTLPGPALAQVEGAQMPAATRPTTEAVTLDVAVGTLHGTLQLPAGEGPYPAVLIVSGSGPTDRDGNSVLIPGKNDGLRMLAEELAARGIASLRFDKRGVAESAAAAGEERDTTFEHLVEDAAGWFRLLRDDARFGRLGVVGHSEGSLIGMLVAEREGADAFVSVAGAGTNAADILVQQLTAQLPQPLLDEAVAVLGELKAGREVEVPNPVLAQLFRSEIQPYMITWFEHDPAAIVGRLQAPVLVVQGTTDLQVPVAEAEKLAAARPGAQLVVVEGMNHVLKHVAAGAADPLASYGDPSLPLAPGFLEPVAEFLNAALRGDR